MNRLTRTRIYHWKPRICQILDKVDRFSSSQSMTYDKCDSCGGRVEVWNDEDTGVCLDCETQRAL
jgi:hypothetical protein